MGELLRDEVLGEALVWGEVCGVRGWWSWMWPACGCWIWVAYLVFSRFGAFSLQTS